MEKTVALYLNKFEFSPPRDALCQLVAKWFLKRRFFLNFVSVFSLFRNYFPLGKWLSPSFEETWILPPKGVLCQVWLKLTDRFWRRRWKCGKFTDIRTDGRTTGDQKSSGGLSAIFYSIFNNKLLIFLIMEYVQCSVVC